MSKKLVTLLLALTLVFSASVPAFAATDADTGVSPSQKTEASASTTENPPASSEASGSSDSSDPSDPSDSAVNDGDSTITDQQEADLNSDQTSDQEATQNTEDKESQADQAKEEKEDNADKEDKEDATEKAAAKKAKKYRDGLASYIRSKNPSLSKSWSKTLAGYFIDAGEKYDLDPTVLMAIAQRESTFRSKATSPYGIKGIMQTSDALARQYGYKPSSLYKAKVSIDVGARYLSAAKKKFGTYTKALSSYVYGSYAVSKGKYSNSHAYAMLKIRRDIKAYLKKYDFV